MLTAKTETNCGHLFDPEPSEERFMFSDLKSGAKCTVSQTVAAAIEGRNEGVEWKASSLSPMENLHDCSRVKLSYARTTLHASFNSQYAILETILLMRWQNRSPGTCQILSSERALIICSQQTVARCLTKPLTTETLTHSAYRFQSYSFQSFGKRYFDTLHYKNNMKEI